MKSSLLNKRDKNKDQAAFYSSRERIIVIIEFEENSRDQIYY